MTYFRMFVINNNILQYIQYIIMIFIKNININKTKKCSKNIYYYYVI